MPGKIIYEFRRVCLWIKVGVGSVIFICTILEPCFVYFESEYKRKTVDNIINLDVCSYIWNKLSCKKKVFISLILLTQVLKRNRLWKFFRQIFMGGERLDGLGGGEWKGQGKNYWRLR